MRAIIPLLLTAILLLAPASPGGDKELLDKFKRQNEASREKLQAEIAEILEKAKALEKDEPAKALLLLQDNRDRMLQKGLLASREDRALAEPLWERIRVLRGMIVARQATELRESLSDFKEYLLRMSEEFAALRKAYVPPAKEIPRGGPAFFALGNGGTAAGWLHEPPVFVVNATVNDEARTFAPGAVAGVQIPGGFFVYEPNAKRFHKFTTSEFFIMAVSEHTLARKPGFWMPSELPEPPPGFYHQSTAAVGAGLFSRSAGALMTTWAGPGGRFPGRAAGHDSVTARMFRDVLIDLQVQESFGGMKKEDRARLRDVMLTFLDRRPTDGPLTQEEILRLGDAVADVFPERRSDSVALAHILNRYLEQNVPQRKER